MPLDLIKQDAAVIASYPWEIFRLRVTFYYLCARTGTHAVSPYNPFLSLHFRTDFLNSHLTVSLGTCEAMLSFHSGSLLLFDN